MIDLTNIPIYNNHTGEHEGYIDLIDTSDNIDISTLTDYERFEFDNKNADFYIDLDQQITESIKENNIDQKFYDSEGELSGYFDILPEASKNLLIDPEDPNRMIIYLSPLGKNKR